MKEITGLNIDGREIRVEVVSGDRGKGGGGGGFRRDFDRRDDRRGGAGGYGGERRERRDDYRDDRRGDYRDDRRGGRDRSPDRREERRDDRRDDRRGGGDRDHVDRRDNREKDHSRERNRDGGRSPRGGGVSQKVSCRFRGEIMEESVQLLSGGELHEIKGQFLHIYELPVVFKERYGAIPSRIYVRQCYRDLYDIVSQHMVTYHDKLPATLFTGVPGIGKSLFLIYFLFRFLHDKTFPDKRFILEFKSDMYCYFIPASNDGSFEMNETPYRNPACPITDVLILSYMSAKVEPKSRGKWLFIFSSPDPLRYKEMTKNSPRFRYTLNTWDYVELLFINANHQIWIERFVVFGGVPRSVFSDGRDDDPMMKLQRALKEKGGIVADHFFKNSFGNIDSESNYMLIHINPPTYPTEDGLKVQYAGQEVYSFASDYVFQQIAEKHRSRLLAEPIDLFNIGVASEVYGGGSAGTLFEKICLWLKPMAGTEITATSMASNAPYTFRLPAMSVLPYHWKEDAKNDETKKLRPNVLYQPKISNLESGDAFCVVQVGVDPNGNPIYVLIVLQITVGERHPVKVNGLFDIVSSYPQAIQELMFQKLLIFVTPVDGKLSGAQSLTTQNGKVAERIPELVKGFVQCVYRHAV